MITFWVLALIVFFLGCCGLGFALATNNKDSTLGGAILFFLSLSCIVVHLIWGI
jgi:hypothetical protein